MLLLIVKLKCDKRFPNLFNYFTVWLMHWLSMIWLCYAYNHRSKPLFMFSGVLRILCLPISNAEIERVFSQVNLVRNSRRSGIKADLLEAILFCKFGIRKFGKTVAEFKPTLSMLKFDSSIYEWANKTFEFIISCHLMIGDFFGDFL